MLEITNNKNFVHLFHHPLCNQQGLLRRIANVLFHVFTLFIPLAIYSVITCSFARKAREFNPQDCVCHIKAPALNSIQSQKLHDDTIAFVNQYLTEYPTEPVLYDCGGEHTSQPINLKINQLMTRSNNFAWEILDTPDHAPYKNTAIQAILDSQMKIRYAISVLALEEIPQVRKEKECTTIDALRNQNSHLIVNFFHFSKFYHRIRGEVYHHSNGIPYHCNSAEHTANFYQEGTLQNQWRLLYNDYCSRVRSIIREKDLRKASLNHHANWTQPDLSPGTFRPIPGSLPGVASW